MELPNEDGRELVGSEPLEPGSVVDRVNSVDLLVET